MSIFGRLCLFCALAVVLAAACPVQAAQADTLPAVLTPQPDLSILANAIGVTGFTQALQACGPFTVFAPIDSAWARLCKPTASELITPCNKEMLTSILQYHVVCGNYSLRDFDKFKCCVLVLKTIGGGTLNITERDGCFYVDGARILGEGIPTGNGTLFKIDRVLIPPGVRVQQSD